MVWEYNSTNIVMLCPLEEDDKVSCRNYRTNISSVIMGKTLLSWFAIDACMCTHIGAVCTVLAK